MAGIMPQTKRKLKIKNAVSLNSKEKPHKKYFEWLQFEISLYVQ